MSRYASTRDMPRVKEKNRYIGCQPRYAVKKVFLSLKWILNKKFCCCCPCKQRAAKQANGKYHKYTNNIYCSWALSIIMIKVANHNPCFNSLPKQNTRDRASQKNTLSDFPQQMEVWSRICCVLLKGLLQASTCCGKSESAFFGPPCSIIQIEISL